MWTVESGSDRVLVRPTGHVYLDESIAAAKQLETLVEEFSEPCVLVIDLRWLTSYDASVRKVWQETIKTNKHRFREMIWISDRALHRMVAASVSLFSGIPGRVVGSDEDHMKIAV